MENLVTNAYTKTRIKLDKTETEEITKRIQESCHKPAKIEIVPPLSLLLSLSFPNLLYLFILACAMISIIVFLNTPSNAILNSAVKGHPLILQFFLRA